MVSGLHINGTFIPIKIGESQRGRYKNKKGDISLNVMCACTIDKHFTYVLSGWEGSAADGCVSRDALTCQNGLIVNARRTTWLTLVIQIAKASLHLIVGNDTI